LLPEGWTIVPRTGNEKITSMRTAKERRRVVVPRFRGSTETGVHASGDSDPVPRFRVGRKVNTLPAIGQDILVPRKGLPVSDLAEEAERLRVMREKLRRGLAT
jgi:hypothetical protein